MIEVTGRIICLGMMILMLLCGFDDGAGAGAFSVILSGIIFSGLGYCFDRKEVLHLLLIGVGGLLVLIDIKMVCLVGICLFEVIYGNYDWKKVTWKKKAEFVLAGIIFIAGTVRIVRVSHRYEFVLTDDYGQGVGQWIVLAVFYIMSALVGVFVAEITTRYRWQKDKLIHMRDDNEEFKGLMLQKNELLRRQQDNEIVMATLKERNRIAREIHDNVGHLLSRSILQMGALQAVYRQEPINSSLKQISVTLNESMDSIRNSVHNLHNEALDFHKLVEDIIGEYHDYEVVFDDDMREDTPKEIKYCFIAVIKEAFTNVRKHSDATKIFIMARENDSLYQLSINDNGSKAGIRDSGIGLHNMESRVAELGGNIIFSAERGFRIFLTVPKEVKQGGA